MIKEKNKNMNGKKIVISCLLGCISTISYHPSASALNFNFSYGTNVTYQQKVATELAGKIWSDYLTDSVTVNIHFEMANSSDFPASNIIGGAIPFWQTGYNYSDFRTKLTADKQTADDNIATASLNTGTSWTSSIGSLPTSSNKINLTKANAKAIGAISATNSSLDGLILMNNLNNTGVTWQYDYLSNVGTNQLDFTSVLVHEIGHLLGFVTALDTSEEYTCGTNFLSTCLPNLTNSFTAMDMFRYRNGQRQLYFSGNFIDYLSLDGGKTKLADVARGIGSYQNLIFFNQGSHWKNELNAGMMDPVLELGQRAYLSNNSLDLRVFDALGWDKTNSSKSLSTLKTEAQNVANTKGNVNRNTELNTMFQQYGWGGKSSSSTLGQNSNLPQFLNQQGFFQVGSFWESFDGQPTAVPESSANVALIAGGLLALSASLSRKKS